METLKYIGRVVVDNLIWVIVLRIYGKTLANPKSVFYYKKWMEWFHEKYHLIGATFLIYFYLLLLKLGIAKSPVKDDSSKIGIGVALIIFIIIIMKFSQQEKKQRSIRLYSDK